MLAAPPAQVVVLAHAIAGVPLGATRAGLTSRLGSGVVLRTGAGDFGPFAIVRYAKPAVRVTYTQGVATSVSTGSVTYPTRQGIAVGASVARLREVYGTRLACGNGSRCMLGQALPGHAATIFELRRARVVRIDVSAVLD